MTPFEEQLRQAMARREPSKDFTARVLAKTRKHETRSRIRRWLERVHFLRLAPVMAAFLVMTGGAVYQEHERVVRGEQAKQKLLVAMRIAGTKLNVARARIIELETNREVER